MVLIILFFLCIIKKKGGKMLEYTINIEQISMMLYFIKYLFIDIGSYYIFLRLSKENNNLKQNSIATIEIIVITYLYTLLRVKDEPIYSMVLLIIFITLIFIQKSKRSIGTAAVIAIVSLGISFSIFFISTAMNSIPNIIFHTQNRIIAIIGICITYLVIYLLFINNRRLKNGIISFSNPEN